MGPRSPLPLSQDRHQGQPQSPRELLAERANPPRHPRPSSPGAASLCSGSRGSPLLSWQVHERTEEMDFLLLVVRKLLRTNSRFVKVSLLSRGTGMFSSVAPPFGTDSGSEGPGGGSGAGVSLGATPTPPVECRALSCPETGRPGASPAHVVCAVGADPPGKHRSCVCADAAAPPFPRRRRHGPLRSPLLGARRLGSPADPARWAAGPPGRRRHPPRLLSAAAAP